MSYILRTEKREILIEGFPSVVESNVLYSPPRVKTADEVLQPFEIEHFILRFIKINEQGEGTPSTFEEAVTYFNNDKYALVYSDGEVVIAKLGEMYQRNTRYARSIQTALINLEPDAKQFNRFILPMTTGGDGKAELKMKFNQQIETTGAIQNIEQFQIVTSIPTSFYKDTATAPNKIIPVQTVQMRGVFVYIFKASDASTTFSTGTVVVNPTGAIPNPIMAVYTTLPWSYGEF